MAYADKANERLWRKFYRIALRSKRNIAKSAVARELVCFIWGKMTEHYARQLWKYGKPQDSLPHSHSLAADASSQYFFA